MSTLGATNSDAAPAWRDRLDDALGRVQFATYLVLVVLLLALGLLWPRMFISIPTGSHGVMFRYFAGGTVVDQVWREGLQIVPPWDSLTLYESRLQQKLLRLNVLSEEGLELVVELSVRYRPYTEMLGHLHQDVGPEYFERMIEPDIAAHVRRLFGHRPAHELYASASDLLAELRRAPSLGRLAGDGEDSRVYVHIQEINLLSIRLPELVQRAIAEKYRQEQLMLEYRYKLERETHEAERKRTEAGGIRDYNSIMGELSPDTLRWRELDVTAELAKSPSSKVVLMGGAGSHPSLLLNLGADQPAATPPATPP